MLLIEERCLDGDRRERCQTCRCAGLVPKHIQPSIDFLLTEQAVAKIGGAFHVPPVKWPVHDFATGIDVEIRGGLNCSKETMASYNGGAQECIASCEAEVEPAGFVLALLSDQQGTACSFGSPHALPEVIAMGVGHIQKGALPRSEVRRWVLCLLQRDLVWLIARRRCFRTGSSYPLAAIGGLKIVDVIPESLRPGDDVILHR
jgi:hypothetical protein